jgi:outer membrane protein insertion porin family
VKHFIYYVIFIHWMLYNLSDIALASEIQKINIRGNTHVPQSSIEKYISFKIGDQYSKFNKNKTIKNLYSTSIFNNVKIVLANNILEVEVIENPFIKHIEFKGNNKIKTETLQKIICLSPGKNLQQVLISQDKNTIQKLYSNIGYVEATVTTKLESLPDNTIKVIFNIIEGPLIRIKQIHFEGNQFCKSKTLKSKIQTKIHKFFLFKFLQKNDTFDPKRITTDKSIIKNFYNSIGFIDCKIISVTKESAQSSKGLVITYALNEGKQYKFDQINLKDYTGIINQQEILKRIPIKKGDIFSPKSIQKVSQKIQNYLFKKHHIQIKIYPKIQVHQTNHSVNLTIIIDKVYNKKLHIKNINIQGNLKTNDTIIRNYLNISEGDIYDYIKIKKNFQQLKNINCFKSIKITPKNKKKYYDINIKIAEESGTLGIGLNIDDDTKIVTVPNKDEMDITPNISFLDKNLAGSTKNLELIIEANNDDKLISYYTCFTTPNFLKTNISLKRIMFYKHSLPSLLNILQKKKSDSIKSIGIINVLEHKLQNHLHHKTKCVIAQDHCLFAKPHSQSTNQEEKTKKSPLLK